jgi:hypothetical protein
MQDTGKRAEQTATWLDDDQYQMLFGEQRDHASLAEEKATKPRPNAAGTRWDRHRTVTASAPLCPPAIPTTLDVRDTNARIELDIFAEDRETRVSHHAPVTRLQAPPIPPEYVALTPPPIAEDTEQPSRLRTRAVSLGFAFGALAATIALWLIGVSIYY